MKKAAIQLLFVGLFFGSIWAFVIYYTEDENDSWKVWDAEMEVALGESILKNYAPGNNLMLVWSEAYVDSSWEEISNILELERSEVRAIYITNDEEVNAYTIPGDNILICLPLVEFVETPEEFVAIIAHEMGHIHHNHVMEMIIQQFTVSAVISVVTGQSSSTVIQISEMMFNSAFSREKEREADLYALDYLSRMQIPASGLIDFFDRLEEENYDVPELMSAISSHPMNEERIQMIQQADSGSVEFKKIDMSWTGFQEYMQSLLY